MNKITEKAIEAAARAGEILREGFGAEFNIMNKEGKNNLVTEYDYRSEETIIGMIKQAFPDSSFLAEESGKGGREGAGLRWVIDPLDGTVNFAHKLPVFSVSIAAELDGRLVSGVIYHPMLDEMFVAERSAGAFLNGRAIKVSRNADFDSAFLVTGFPYNVTQNPKHCLETFVSMIRRGIPVRRLGSAALDLAYVAAGRFDGFWELNLNPWDVAAGAILVEEAGGRVTTYTNEEYSIYADTILATNGLIHDESVRTLEVPPEM